MARLVLIFILAQFLSAAAIASDSGTERYLHPSEPKRLALIMSNGVYKNFGTLPGATTDADKMETTLKALGFEVTRADDVKTFAQFQWLYLVPFVGKIAEGDFVVFYYSGHGFSYGAENYIVPVEAPPTVPSIQVNTTFPPESAIRSLIADHKPGMILVILDACRNFGGVVDDGGKGAGIKKGLQETANAGVDTIIGFASAPGTSAYGLPAGSPSPYTSALVQQMARPDIEFSQVKKEVIYAVKSDPNALGEVPWFSDSEVSEIFLKPSKIVQKAERESWQAALAEGTNGAVDRYLNFHRVGLFANAARQWLEDHAGSARVKYTQVSPLIPELAWSSDTAQTFSRFTLPLGVSRSLDLSGSKTAIASIDRNDIDHLLELQGHAVALSDVEAKLDSGETFGEPISIGRGTSLKNVRVNQGVVHVTTINDGELRTAALSNTRQATSGISVGRPLVELALQPPAGGSRDVVSSEPLTDLLKRLRSEGRIIGWVSISTPRVESQREQGLLGLQASDAKYILKNNGVAESRITTVEGVDRSPDGVKVRFFGF